MPRSTFTSSIVLAVGFLTVWLGMACQNVCLAEDVYLAFWNVENLFDTEDNPNEEGDEDFTPTGVKKWTEERLTRKISNLSRVIRAMNDDRGPDILGLAEVENQKMAELLAAQMTVKPHRYKVVHRDSPSRRGIDCAIVYDEAKFTLKSSQFFTIDGTEQPTRMIVEAELADAQGGKLFVFANHWPSRAHPESDRILAAKVLRKRVDEILKADANADFVAFGDFNDFADDPALVETLLTVEKPADAKEGKLLNATWPLFRRGEGSYVYQNKWETIDHVIVSPGMLNKQGFRLKLDSVNHAVLAKDQLFDPTGPSIARPNRTFSGDFYHASGYSDHLPVKLVLERE